jgi:hypothetical protein
LLAPVAVARSGPPVAPPPASPELERARQNAAAILFIVAALHIVCSGAYLLFGSDTFRGGDRLAFAMRLGVIAGVFAGLAIWAMSRCLPAASIGLALFLLLTVLAWVRNPETREKGVPMTVILTWLLARAIRLAWKSGKSS